MRPPPRGKLHHGTRPGSGPDRRQRPETRHGLRGSHRCGGRLSADEQQRHEEEGEREQDGEQAGRYRSRGCRAWPRSGRGPSRHSPSGLVRGRRAGGGFGGGLPPAAGRPALPRGRLPALSRLRRGGHAGSVSGRRRFGACGASRAVRRAGAGRGATGSGDRDPTPPGRIPGGPSGSGPGTARSGSGPGRTPCCSRASRRRYGVRPRGRRDAPDGGRAHPCAAGPSLRAAARARPRVRPRRSARTSSPARRGCASCGA